MLNLFVYGTLKEGEINAGLIPPGSTRRRAWTRGILRDAGLFPGLEIPSAMRLGTSDYEADAALCRSARLAETPGLVEGELVETPPRVLAALDALEGFLPGKPRESLFLRILAEARLEDGSRVPAWTYAGRPKVLAGRPILESG